MNSFFPTMLIFCIGVFISCRNQTSALKDYKEGLTIDSSICQKIKKDHTEEKAPLSELDVRVFENDKLTGIPLFTGDKVSHNSYTHYQNDTLSIVLTNAVGAVFGLQIKKTKDTCIVIHGFSVRDAPGSFKLKLTDPTYESGLLVPCRYVLVLDKNEYKAREAVCGYIDCTSDDYYVKGEKGDIKKRVSYKGYFSAYIWEKN